MAHFAVLCPEASGHLNPMSAVLLRLASRGHQITWIGTEDGVDRLAALGIKVATIARESFPRGSMEKQLSEIGKLSGLTAARRTLDCYRQAMVAILDEAPAAVAASGATAILGDESVFATRTVAEITSLPFMTVCNALPFHPDIDHPPLFPAWDYRRGGWARLRNRLGRIPARIMMRPIAQAIAQARRRHGLPTYDFERGNVSRLATVAQMPAEFDFPRSEIPKWFHYVGALHDATLRPPVEFPFERLDGRPLVYASLGTVQNRLLPLFETIAQACAPLPVQLVVSLGGSEEPEAVGQLPGEPVVVRYAPQLDLLGRAAIVVTHAGMNTTMECLAHGVPMVAVPITNDQPAVASRIGWSGAGVTIGLTRVTSKRLRTAIEKVLGENRFRSRARELQQANARAGGIDRVVKVVEAVC